MTMIMTMNLRRWDLEKVPLALACAALLGLGAACSDDEGGEDMMEGSETGETQDTGDGDGDTGDGDGDGDGDTGDGDGDGDTGEGDGDGDTGEGEGDGDTGDGDGDSGGGDFAAVYELLVAQGCTAGYCHGANQGGLTLTDEATSYMNLVDVDATTPVCDLQKRVVAGDPEQSIMWRRVRPAAMDMGMACAEKMPQGSEGLSEADAQIVYDWILGGALP